MNLRSSIVVLSLFVVHQVAAWPVITNSYSVSVIDTVPLNIVIRQGEVREIVVKLTEGKNPLDLSGMDASYLYRPKSGQWFSITGVVDVAESSVSFQWDSTRDPGFVRYEGWLRLEDAVKTPVFVANLGIGMLSTPGFSPNASSLQAEPIDWSVLSMTNSPWATSIALDNASNSLSVAISDAVGPLASTGYVASAIAAIPPPAPQVETDPIWGAVSVAVTDGAAKGATAIQVETDPVALPIATNALAVAQDAVHTNETGGITLLKDSRYGLAVSRFNSVAIGENVVITNAPSYLDGGNSRSQSFAIGFGAEARAYRSFALGERAITRNTLDAPTPGYGEDYAAFVWSGRMFVDYFGHGTGTFNIDPYGGLDGFYIGEDRMSDIINEAIGYVLASSLPGPGCTTLTGITPTITGATYNYYFSPTNSYTLGVSTNAPRYNYVVFVAGTNACTFGAGIQQVGTWTPGGTNTVVVGAYTGGVWRAKGAVDQ